MKRAVHLHIKGIVQGVFFRQFTMGEANRLGIKGWVRNNEDGSVDVEAEGEESTLDQFIEWCHHGPKKATVTKVEVKNSELKNLSTFEIRE